MGKIAPSGAMSLTHWQWRNKVAVGPRASIPKGPPLHPKKLKKNSVGQIMGPHSAGPACTARLARPIVTPLPTGDGCGIKLEFHGTDTDILANFRSSRESRRVRRLSRSARHEPDTPTCPPTCPTRALFLARMSVGDARVYTCIYVYCTRVRVLYMTSYRVHVYKITR